MTPVRITALLLVALLVAPLATALPLAARAEHAPAPAVVLEQRLRDLAHGDLAQQGRFTVRHAGSGAVTATLTAADFLQHARGLLARFGPGTAGFSSGDRAVGLAVDEPLRSRLGGSPFCENGAVFVEWEGPPGTGSSIVEADPSPLGDVNAAEVCGGFYGPTHTFTSLGFDTTANGATVLVACAEATVFVPDAPNNTVCGWTTASVHGNAAVNIESFCFFSVCLGLDYALCEGCVILLGSALVPA